MPSKKLSRSTYRDPNLVNSPIRSGDVARGEAATDMDEYYRSLEQIHGSGTHGWGIADGLRVTATLNQAGIKVLPGIAIDLQGRHIALAEGGNAEIGSNADVPGMAPALTHVAANGATVPTAALAAGNHYITIQWWETFDTDAYNLYGIYRINHTPWIRLLPAGGFANDGLRIVMAHITLGAGGIVTGMTQEFRRAVSLPAQVLYLRKGVTASGQPNFAVDNATSGEVRSRTAGGMELAVLAAEDEIHMLRDGGNFAKLSMAAEQIVARRSDGKESVVIDTQYGNIIAGTQGVTGDILVKDASDRLVITLDGDDAVIVVGATGKEGDILVKDSAGQNSVRIDGNTGTIATKRLTPTTGSANFLDVDARALRIHGWDLCLDGRSGGNKRALVDLGNRLVINYGIDYADGVAIEKLHLQEHIKGANWEKTDVAKRPIYNQWITFFELKTGLPLAEWSYVTMCEIGMLDQGTVDNFWWGVRNRSHGNDNGNIVIKWDINYRDRGDDWRPWTMNVMWLAFRR